VEHVRAEIVEIGIVQNAKKNADIVERFVAKRDMTPTCLTFGEVRLKHVIAVA
jgi:hypothetical protein